jgi:4-amino-4-deoxychorismate lyase
MILVNGEPHGKVSATDRGFAYGDGVFRTFPAHNGKPMHWPRQYAKLARDGAALGLPVPPAGVLSTEVRSACAGVSECAVKIVLTRGAGDRGYRYAEEGEPTRVVLAQPLSPGVVERRAGGVAARLCSLKLGHQPALAGLKHLNRLENVLARAEWSDPEIAEGIMCDTEGNVICGTMTNIFITCGGALATPRLDRCGVAGVTRERVMEAAGRAGHSCAITTLTWDEVLGADEVFLVNSLAGIWPVRDLDGQPRTPGRITRERGLRPQRWRSGSRSCSSPRGACAIRLPICRSEARRFRSASTRAARCVVPLSRWCRPAYSSPRCLSKS